MTVIDESALNVFTDGSSYSRPRKGGLGARFVWFDKKGREEIWDYSPLGYTGATNNQMELQACIDVLKVILAEDSPVKIGSVSKIVIYTDSLYIVDNWDRAAYQWYKNRWMNRNGKPVENAQLWKELISLRRKVRKRVEARWVKGHEHSEHNKAADKLAKASAKNAAKQQISVFSVRRKLSRNVTETGSVAMEGQRITVRIIQDEWLRLAKCYKYRYEVVSKKSKYYQKVDFIFSEIMLSAGHNYEVRFNNEQKNPKIVKLYKKLK